LQKKLDLLVKQYYDKATSQPVKQLCLELVSDTLLLKEQEETNKKKKPRVVVEEKDEPKPASAPLPQAKKAKKIKTKQ
jgi:hypothetical protein